MPSKKKATSLFIFFVCLFDRAKMASEKRHGQERAGVIYRNLCSLVTYKHILTCVCNEYSIKKLHWELLVVTNRRLSSAL